MRLSEEQMVRSEYQRPNFTSKERNSDRLAEGSTLQVKITPQCVSPLFPPYDDFKEPTSLLLQVP